MMFCLDQEGGTANLLSIDFAKAFNTMSHQACLNAMLNKNVSGHVLRMTSEFLKNRKMQFRVGRELSSKRLLNGGAPQGTLLGNFLFILTTDEIEERRQPLVNTPEITMDTVTRVREREREMTPRKDYSFKPLMDTAHFSTPTTRGQFAPFSRPTMVSDDEENDSLNFEFFDPNRPRPNRLEDSEEAESSFRITVREEAIPRPARWTEMELALYKYIDDFLSLEKSWMGDGLRWITSAKQRTVLEATKCQEFFHRIVESAAAVGLSVNEKKTQLLCVSAAVDSNVSSYITLKDGSKIESQETLKQLGFTFSKKPTIDEHLKQTAEKFRRRLWFLRYLKKAMVPPNDLLRIYKTFLIPIIDYASVVYHSLLTKDQSNALKRLQSSALKIIFGWKKSYGSILEENNIELISQRRQRLTDKFIIKAAKHVTYKEKWFPLKSFTHHDLRSELFYEEKFARTDRLYKAPLYYYRRRLNEIYTPTE